jgi:hypothetical protein
MSDAVVLDHVWRFYGDCAALRDYNFSLPMAARKGLALSDTALEFTSGIAVRHSRPPIQLVRLIRSHTTFEALPILGSM